MSQLPYHVVIVDLDRTLLRTDKTISEYTQGVLREWRQAGAYLFAATARPERAIADYRRIISFHAVTTLNGARTLTPEHTYENAIETEDALFILNQLCETKDMVISVEAENGIYANQDIPVWHPALTDDIREIPKKERIYKILASHPGRSAEEIRIDLPETVYSTVADKKLRQYMSRTATKWRGIQQLLESVGLKPDQTVRLRGSREQRAGLRESSRG